jgi:hypothetical protein
MLPIVVQKSGTISTPGGLTAPLDRPQALQDNRKDMLNVVLFAGSVLPRKRAGLYASLTLLALEVGAFEALDASWSAH